IHSLNMEKDQFINLFATVRANIEMNLVKEEEDRYAGINVSPIKVVEMAVNNVNYDVATFKISGMRETKYSEFIQEYKDNYGKKEFNLEGHFERRKEATLERTVDFWLCWKMES
ncbi:MAG: hypothetical protein OIF32_01860, partial [Campylobacterales bacterium]|nr:hypothetical protein [Campylobacterales bacterium]